jgi:hypothetical protein
VHAAERFSGGALWFAQPHIHVDSCPQAIARPINQLRRPVFNLLTQRYRSRKLHDFSEDAQIPRSGKTNALNQSL